MEKSLTKSCSHRRVGYSLDAVVPCVNSDLFSRFGAGFKAMRSIILGVTKGFATEFELQDVSKRTDLPLFYLLSSDKGKSLPYVILEIRLPSLMFKLCVTGKPFIATSVTPCVCRRGFCPSMTPLRLY